MQTEQVNSHAAAVQTRTYADAEVQAAQNDAKIPKQRDWDMTSVGSFLKETLPLMTAQLQMASRSTALPHYCPVRDKDQQQLSVSPLFQLAFPARLRCSGISWNCTGSVVALSCSIPTHDGWCLHDSSAFLWSLHRQTSKECKPSSILNTEGCLSALAFHSHKSAILVAGTLHGDIILWDLGRDLENWITGSNVIKGEHHDAVTGVHWSTYVDTADSFLSCSLDGRILYWKLIHPSQKPEPKERFIITTDSMPQSMNIKSGASSSSAIGVTSVSLNQFDPSLFVIGTEGGAVLQGSLNSSKHLPYISGSLDEGYKCPVVKGFHPHKGHVIKVCYSPFSRNVFLSSGVDQTVKVFSHMQAQPTAVIQMAHEVASVQWSPKTPVMLTVLQRDGHIKFFDIRSLSIPYAEIESGIQHCTASALQYCQNQPDLLCAARDDGSAEVWQLGENFVCETDFLQVESTILL
ncbi:cytoplasmic dynein 2 intermediate chain 2-like isoform X2 [Ornithodoros turicata]